MICLYKERDIFKNGFTNVLNFAFTNVVYLVRKLNVTNHYRHSSPLHTKQVSSLIILVSN